MAREPSLGVVVRGVERAIRLREACRGGILAGFVGMLPRRFAGALEADAGQEAGDGRGLVRRGDDGLELGVDLGFVPQSTL